MPDYYWDPDARLYYYWDDEDGDGEPEKRYVSRDDQRKWLLLLILLLGNRLKSLAERLRLGTTGDVELGGDSAAGLTLSEWRLQMADEIRNEQVAIAMIASGGQDQMTPSKWATVGTIIKTQYDYLGNFARGIETGDVPLDDRFVLRGMMYADAGWGTFERFTRDIEIEAGVLQFERRVLEPGADHCEDCVEYADEGWQPIGTLPEIGDSQCNVRCRCEFEFGSDAEAT